jgi:hypothetical protein
MTRMPQSSAGPGWRRFDGDGDGEGLWDPGWELAAKALDTLGSMTCEEDYFIDAEANEFAQNPCKKWAPTAIEQGLRHIRGQRAESRAKTADQNCALTGNFHWVLAP